MVVLFLVHLRDVEVIVKVILFLLVIDNQGKNLELLKVIKVILGFFNIIVISILLHLILTYPKVLNGLLIRVKVAWENQIGLVLRVNPKR